MPGSKSNYLENAALNGVLGGPAFVLPPNVFVALSSALWSEANTGTSFNEIVGNGYARVATVNDAVAFPPASNGVKYNGVTFTFPAASADWPDILSFAILDALSGGNLLYGGDLLQAREIAAGDTASFGPGSMTFTED